MTLAGVGLLGLSLLLVVETLTDFFLVAFVVQLEEPLEDLPAGRFAT